METWKIQKKLKGDRNAPWVFVQDFVGLKKDANDLAHSLEVADPTYEYIADSKLHQ